MDPAPFHAEIADCAPPDHILWSVTRDGTRLRIGIWTDGPRGIVVLFPGRTEMIEKYGRVISDLAARGYGAAVIDWRGQGLSDRVPHAPLLGDVADFALFQEDVVCLRGALDHFAGAAPRHVLAHSMGGCIALRALIAGFPAQSAAFSAPMWGLPLGGGLGRVIAGLQPLLARTRLAQRDVPGAGIEFRLWENPFDNNDLTSHRATYDWMQAQVNAHPDLRLGAPSLRWLSAALDETAALAQLPSPTIPAFCGLGSRERIVAPQAIKDRMAQWPNGRLEIFEGALHELLMEAPGTRARFISDCCDLFDRQMP